MLLDILLPNGPDGYEVCRRIREFSDVAVIMLTARAQESDMLRGFDAGADDYLTKPFSAKELVARVQAVLRRARHAGESTMPTLACGELEIDLARRTVKVRGEARAAHAHRVRAAVRELAANANRVLVHEELLTAVWGAEYRNDVDYLRAYVHYLRRKLEAEPSNPRYILTSQGVGYMLACPE